MQFISVVQLAAAAAACSSRDATSSSAASTQGLLSSAPSTIEMTASATAMPEPPLNGPGGCGAAVPKPLAKAPLVGAERVTELLRASRRGEPERVRLTMHNPGDPFRIEFFILNDVTEGSGLQWVVFPAGTVNPYPRIEDTLFDRDGNTTWLMTGYYSGRLVDPSRLLRKPHS